MIYYFNSEMLNRNITMVTDIKMFIKTYKQFFYRKTVVHLATVGKSNILI